MHYRLLIAACLPSLLLASCSGSDSGPAPPEPGFDLLLTDAPTDDLLAFSGTVQAARLVREDGSSTDDLLSGPLRVDLLELNGLSKWLVSGSVEESTYRGVRLDFDPFGFDAVAADGSAVPVFAAGSTLDLEFPTLVQGGGTSYLEVVADFDLAESLSGDIALGSLTVIPSGSAKAGSSDSGSTAIDELKGRVLQVDAAARELVLDAFADGDLAVPLGEITVEVPGSTVLFDDDGFLFASIDAFFSALVPGATLLEVHGDLIAGRIRADRIEVEDSFGSGSSIVAELRGLVVGLDLPDTLQLLIAEVEQGTSVVQAALGPLGNPSSIQVQLLASTQVTLDAEPNDLPASLAALAVGQEVEIKFATFLNAPFPAARIEIDDQELEYQGFVTDLSELPVALVMRLESSEPAVLSGQVASSQTDVRVSLAGAPLFLKSDGSPGLQAFDLQVGLKLEVEGALSGSPEAPQIAASRAGVFPGRLDDALRSTVNPAGPGFSTIGGQIQDPFGAGLTEGPIDFLIAPGAVFDGDANSLAAFLGLAGSVEVEVFGLATGQPNQARAYEIKSRIDD